MFPPKKKKRPLPKGEPFVYQQVYCVVSKNGVATGDGRPLIYNSDVEALAASEHLNRRFPEAEVRVRPAMLLLWDVMPGSQPKAAESEAPNE
jgi:hypothetical protein